MELRYFAPGTVEEALALSQQFGEDAKLLAGGQSLMPAINMRLSRPQVLIDLNRIPGLDHLHLTGDELTIGALTRHRTLEQSETVRRHCPILAHAAALIGHTHIRNRGTIGGSLAHHDPVGELPALLRLLDGRVVVRGAGRVREVRAADFFTGIMSTVLEPGEILTEVRVPVLPDRAGWSFREFVQRHGDFAMVGAGAVLHLDATGRVAGASLVTFGAGPMAQRQSRAEALLAGQEPTAELFRQAAALAAADTDPIADVHASSAYRRHLTGIYVRDALTEALGRTRRG